jgi:preprotein translocase subunit SecE
MKDKILSVLAVLALVAGIGGFYYFGELDELLRAGMVVVAVIVALVIAMQTTSGKSAWEFAKSSRQELRKVVWPSRKETVQTTLVVFAIVVVVGVYVWLIDTGLGWAVKKLLVG